MFINEEPVIKLGWRRGDKNGIFKSLILEVSLVWLTSTNVDRNVESLSNFGLG
jgi:hypothetical protein